jgi:hypothetical protein
MGEGEKLGRPSKIMKPIRISLIAAAILLMTDLAFAQTWYLPNTGFLSKQVNSICPSADGTMLAATISGIIYTSTNSGTTWVSRVAGSVAGSSADGNKLVAFFPAGGIYTSTNAGVTWTQTGAPTSAYWGRLASSADGCVLVAGIATNGPIYVSTNSGTFWTQTTAPSNNWGSIALSADGSQVAAAAANLGGKGSIFTSPDAGVTWVQTSAPSNTWGSIASSADGSKLVAAVDYPQKGLIYTSTNSGATWISNSAPNCPGGWVQVASSADGVKLVAVGSDSKLVSISTNSGASWNSNNVPNTFWLCVASSADGNKLMAGSGGISLGAAGGVYISQTISSPELNLAPALNNLTLGWTVPSANFVLQQSADLVSWSNVSDLPVFNFANLQNQITLAASNSGSFYRLKTP